MNRMNKFFFNTVAWLMVAMSGLAQTNMTLRECIETGLTNNFDVQQRQLQMQSDEANWKQSRLNVFPDLNASAGHSFNQGRSIDPFTNSPVTESFSSSNYSISSGIVLFNGLSILNNIKQNSMTYKAASMDWQQEKDNLTITIILAYLQVLSNADQLITARNQADLTAQQVARLETLNKEGAIKPSDLSDLKGQHASDQINIIDTENALELAKINLCRLMNIPYKKDLVLEKIEPQTIAAGYGDPPDIIYQTALENLALIKAAEFRKKSAERAIKVAQGQLFPRLTFGGTFFTNYSSVANQSTFINTTDFVSDDYVVVNGAPSPVIYKQDNFSNNTIGYTDQLNNNISNTFGFSLTVPLFNALSQRNRIKQARLTFKNTELAQSTTKIQLNQDINRAYVNMNTSADRYKTILLQVDAFTESFRAAGVRFQQGVGTSIDYLITKNSLDRANISLIIAKYDFVLRTKILDYYQGKPLF